MQESDASQNISNPQPVSRGASWFWLTLLAITFVSSVALIQYKEKKPPRKPGIGGKGSLPGNLQAMIKSFSQSYGRPHINQTVDGNPFTIGPEKFESGIGTHANSKITLSLAGRYKRLTGMCGVDSEAGGKGTLIFKIKDRDKELFSSPLMEKGDPAIKFSVSVEGRQEVELIVEDGGDGINFDHADWVNLRLE